MPRPGGLSTPQLVLASSSPRRRELLTEYGYRAVVAPTGCAESSAAWLTVRELVLLNAGRKAAAAAATHPANVVLGADTLVSLAGRPLGKPVDRAEAESMLGSLAGRTHQVYSGVCLLRCQPECSASFVCVSQVRLRALSRAELTGYLDLIDPLDKAGAYAAQEHGERIIASISGSRSNVIGLPMETLQIVLRDRFGIIPR
jgi:septum formation protein